MVHEAWGALSAVCGAVNEDKHVHVQQIVQVLRLLGERHRGDIPGLSIPRGIDPLVPLFLECLLHGSNDSKEMAADGLAVLVRLTRFGRGDDIHFLYKKEIWKGRNILMTKSPLMQ